MTSNPSISHSSSGCSPFSPPLHVVSMATSGSTTSKSASSHSLRLHPMPQPDAPQDLPAGHPMMTHAAQSWETRGCGPLSSAIRHSYIPTMLTPPQSSTAATSLRKAPPLQLVPVRTTQSSSQSLNTTIHSGRDSHRSCRSSRIGPWQFVDPTNDSPLFRIMSTPQTDPPALCSANAIPPMLQLNQQISDSPGRWSESTLSAVHSVSTHSVVSDRGLNTITSSGIVLPSHCHSLSAPSSALMAPAAWRDANASPSPEVVAHPEHRIVDLHDALPPMVSLSRSEEEEMERELSLSRSSLCCAHRDVKAEGALGRTLGALCSSGPSLETIASVNGDEDGGGAAPSSSSLSSGGASTESGRDGDIRGDVKTPNQMENAKSMPVTISDFLGLDSGMMGGMGSSIDVDYVETKIQQMAPRADAVEGDAGSLSESHLDSERIPSDEALDPHFVDTACLDTPKAVPSDSSSEPVSERVGAECSDEEVEGVGAEMSVRAQRLLEVSSLFDAMYRRVMEGDDPPAFYAQSATAPPGRGDADDIDFVSSEQYASYFGNPHSEPYKNIAAYLRSILPAALVGSGGPCAVDEYDED